MRRPSQSQSGNPTPKKYPQSWKKLDEEVTRGLAKAGLGGANGKHQNLNGQAFFTPIHYTPSYQYPLVVYLHGPGNNQREVSQVFRHISLRNFVAVGVRGNHATDQCGYRFDWSDSPSAVARATESIFCAIEEAKQRYRIHPDRIMIAGYRSGGTMAIRQALASPDTFAAAASIGGAMPEIRLGHLDQLRRRRMPMFWQWGADNPRYDVDRLNADLKRAMLIRAKVEVREYPTDDEMDTVALAHLNEWMMNTVVLGRQENVDHESHEVEYSLN